MRRVRRWVPARDRAVLGREDEASRPRAESLFDHEIRGAVKDLAGRRGRRARWTAERRWDGDDERLLRAGGVVERGDTHPVVGDPVGTRGAMGDSPRVDEIRIVVLRKTGNVRVQVDL